MPVRFQLPGHTRWYQKAAEQGNVAAQFKLGRMYEVGLDGRVTKDPAEAARWYRKAAEQGHIRAQVILGLMYEVGRGLTKDLAEAARWYRKAAEQGDPLAKESLIEVARKGVHGGRDGG